MSMSSAIGGLFDDMAATYATRSGVVAIARATAHGLVQGSLAAAQGGSFRAGMLSGAVSSMGGSLQSLLGLDSHPLSSTIAVALVSGTASEIGGGKFANGALSGAIIHVFNHLGEKEAQGRQHQADDPGIVVVVYDGSEPADPNNSKHAPGHILKGIAEATTIYAIDAGNATDAISQIEALGLSAGEIDSIVILDHGVLSGFSNTIRQQFGNNVFTKSDASSLGAYLKRDGILVLGGCGAGSSRSYRQSLANSSGRRVYGMMVDTAVKANASFITNSYTLNANGWRVSRPRN